MNTGLKGVLHRNKNGCQLVENENWKIKKKGPNSHSLGWLLYFKTKQNT